MQQTFIFDRRRLLKSLACVSLAASLGATAESSSPLPVRREGELDIHHIDTGRGNCTLIVAPDGTSVMIDAGASASSLEFSGQPRPNAERRPGEWQARYALRHTGAPKLDYLIVTHIHQDHVGDVSDQTPAAPNAPYRLTGVSDVDRLMPINTIIDRAYPHYGDTDPPAAPFADNYLAFLQDRISNGRTVQAAVIGSDKQIVPRNAPQFTPFAIRVLAGNGRVWTGDRIVSRRPALSSLAAEDRPGENFYSLALRLTYGRFSYFHGGDLNCDTHDGRLPWLDMETPAVRSAGRTEVATADHHGYFDACGPEFVRALDAQAYIIQAWDVGHPGSEQLQRMLGALGTQATHDVFATDILPANQAINRRFVPMLKSRRGHVVVRVAASGDTYRIFVLDSSNENDNVLAESGPYHCRTS